ncbi:hypothetical protein C8R44DRAFT_566355, partial [Mycena epipterygia]
PTSKAVHLLATSSVVAKQVSKNKHVSALSLTETRQGLQFLYRASAADALHNSVERYPQPKCHPETRTEILDNLWNWACGIESSSNNTAASNILWLYGPAGAGK